VALALFDESGGNPFYLQQLARSVRRRVAAVAPSFDVSLGDVEVPDSVAAALGEELAVLDGGTRRVLEGAAVAGDPFELDLAAAGAGLGEASITGPLDELLRQDLVRPTDVPRRFRFRHPIVRSAVYEAARRVAPGSARALRRVVGPVGRVGGDACSPRRAGGAARRSGGDRGP
jgi:predicted ATPase